MEGGKGMDLEELGYFLYMDSKEKEDKKAEEDIKNKEVNLESNIYMEVDDTTTGEELS